MQIFRTMYISYSSLEDWSQVTDIVRCNPDFQDGARFDSIIINSELEPSKKAAPECARLHALYRCFFPSGDHVDVALVREFRRDSKWRPNTVWDGCEVYREPKELSFLLVKHVLRGAVMVPAWYSTAAKDLHYIWDLVDADMFLRLGN